MARDSTENNNMLFLCIRQKTATYW